ALGLEYYKKGLGYLHPITEKEKQLIAGRKLQLAFRFIGMLRTKEASELIYESEQLLQNVPKSNHTALFAKYYATYNCIAKEEYDEALCYSFEGYQHIPKDSINLKSNFDLMIIKALFEMGDYKEVIKRADSMKKGTSNHFDDIIKIQLVHHEAQSYSFLGQHAKAIRTFEEAIPIIEAKMANSPYKADMYLGYSICLYNWYLESNDTIALRKSADILKSAFNLRLNALQITRNLDNFSKAYEMMFIQMNHGTFTKAIEISGVAGTVLGDTKYIHNAISFMEKTRGEVLEFDIATITNLQRAGVPDSLIQKKQRLSTQGFIAEQTIYGNDTTQHLSFDQLVRQQEEFESFLENKYPRYRS
ncbi:MAG: hypothetical protein AAFY76_23850, partial [Cyanobacteria bacterium J06649_11]